MDLMISFNFEKFNKATIMKIKDVMVLVCINISRSCENPSFA